MGKTLPHPRLPRIGERRMNQNWVDGGRGKVTRYEARGVFYGQHTASGQKSR